MKVRHKLWNSTGVVIGLTTMHYASGETGQACVIKWHDPKCPLAPVAAIHNLIFIVPCR